jgi:hypothetical protein
MSQIPTPVPQPSGFVPDPAQTVEVNIERFWQHMATVNSTFATLLRDGVIALTPLPEGQQRTTRRTRFHSRVADSLDAPTPTPESVE